MIVQLRRGVQRAKRQHPRCILRGAPFGAHLRMTDHVTAPSILLVTTGQPGPPRNGRPGCKLHPVAHADVPAAWIAGSFCIKTALARLSSGNDEPKNRLLSRRLAAFEHDDLDFAGPLLRLQQCELVAPKTLYAASE